MRRRPPMRRRMRRTRKGRFSFLNFRIFLSSRKSLWSRVFFGLEFQWGLLVGLISCLLVFRYVSKIHFGFDSRFGLSNCVEGKAALEILGYDLRIGASRVLKENDNKFHMLIKSI